MRPRNTKSTRLCLRPALYITLILPRARISIILRDLSSILQPHRRLLTLRLRNHTNPIIAMSESPIVLFKNTTDSNTSNNTRLGFRRRRIQRITRARLTAQEILR
uniref:Uncharacterized protein n=1 Tax=Gibberella zeae TaxID=5518 RepID=A0A4E9EPX8_GIBZA